VNAVRWRTRAGSGAPPGHPAYSASGAINAALGAAISRYQPREDLDQDEVLREIAVATRIQGRLLTVFVAVCAPAYLVGGIGASCHAPMPVWVTGMLVCMTGATGGGFAALLACKKPLRRLPRLRLTATVCCLFGGVQAAVFLAIPTPAIGLAFLPATLLGLGGLIAAYLTRRAHPYVWGP
jgi:hypothetical protein